MAPNWRAPPSAFRSPQRPMTGTGQFWPRCLWPPNSVSRNEDRLRYEWATTCRGPLMPQRQMAGRSTLPGSNGIDHSAHFSSLLLVTFSDRFAPLRRGAFSLLRDLGLRPAAAFGPRLRLATRRPEAYPAPPQHGLGGLQYAKDEAGFAAKASEGSRAGARTGWRFFVIGERISSCGRRPGIGHSF